MISSEHYNGGVKVSTVWRGIDDSSIEEVYYFLFHAVAPHAHALPSVVRIEYVELTIINHLIKECSAQLLCSSDYLPCHRPKATKELEMIEDMFSSDRDKSYLFMIPVSKAAKFPILVKLNTERERFEFAACCFDQEALDKFVRPIAKKFAFHNDYAKEVMFGILYPEGSRLSVKELPLDDAHVKELDISLNYGQEFEKHHTTVLTKLQNNKRGLFIFHGDSGTGKTTYIKFLAHLFGGKRTFIFIPTTNLEMLVSPSLLPVLLEHKDSILVLEDAEKAVVSRESQQGNESLVSTLLNIGDGILGSMLNLSLIVTFNTKKDQIDNALLRKGRLLYEHEFKPLNITDAQRLIKHLGHKDITAQQPMSLADIYNLTEETGHKDADVKQIGFAT